MKTRVILACVLIGVLVGGVFGFSVGTDAAIDIPGLGPVLVARKPAIGLIIAGVPVGGGVIGTVGGGAIGAIGGALIGSVIAIAYNQLRR